MAFSLDPKLQADTYLIGRLSLCQILLMNNANFPWIILVPEREEITEIFDLSEQDRNMLMQEINFCAKKLKAFTSCDKINIGLIGNIVSQLHCHIVARFDSDMAWPNTVWGQEKVLYKEEQARALTQQLKKLLC